MQFKREIIKNKNIQNSNLWIFNQTLHVGVHVCERVTVQKLRYYPQLKMQDSACTWPWWHVPVDLGVNCHREFCCPRACPGVGGRSPAVAFQRLLFTPFLQRWFCICGGSSPSLRISEKSVFCTHKLRACAFWFDCFQWALASFLPGLVPLKSREEIRCR